MPKIHPHWSYAFHITGISLLSIVVFLGIAISSTTLLAMPVTFLLFLITSFGLGTLSAHAIHTTLTHRLQYGTFIISFTAIMAVFPVLLLLPTLSRIVADLLFGTSIPGLGIAVPNAILTTAIIFIGMNAPAFYATLRKGEPLKDLLVHYLYGASVIVAYILIMTFLLNTFVV